MSRHNTLRDSLFAQLKEQLEPIGQAHVLRWWDELSDASRESLASQILSLDIALLSGLVDRTLHKEEAGKTAAELDPPGVICLPASEENRKARQEAREIGEDALRAGKVCAFTAAGGQATRLGYPKPKGCYPIGPVTNRSLFQIHAEKLKAAAKRYGRDFYWILLTSSGNTAATREYLESEEFFGLPSDCVLFSEQENLPAVDFDGKMMLGRKDHIFTSPNGHGGALKALKDSGALDLLSREGVDQISYFQVDNALMPALDPVFLGFHIQQEAGMSSKAVRKQSPDEKVGLLGILDGRLNVIEYSEMTDEQSCATGPDGQLKFWAGSIAAHVISVSFVRKVQEDGFGLPYHTARKKVPALNEDGELIVPTQPNAIKFETFIFDALPLTERSVILEIPREEQFSPLKNPGGENSPDTARGDLVNLYASWMEAAGERVPRNSEGRVETPVEISPHDREYFLENFKRSENKEGIVITYAK